MTRERAEELLAEKGMWLEEDWLDDARGTWRVWWRPDDRREILASGSTWREAASEALGIPAF